jgi:hypothetical protein
LIKGLGSKPFEVKGSIDPIILENAISIAENYGIRIIQKKLSFFKGGHITTIRSGKLEILLNEDSTNELKLAVLIHEFAHLFLGHTGHAEIVKLNTDKRIKLLDRPNLSTSCQELEAETVSFLLCKKFGLETRSAEYIAAYIKSEEDLIKFSYETVIKMADKIESLFFEKKKNKVENYQTSLFDELKLG